MMMLNNFPQQKKVKCRLPIHNENISIVGDSPPLLDSHFDNTPQSIAKLFRQDMDNFSSVFPPLPVKVRASQGLSNFDDYSSMVNPLKH